MPPVRNSTRHIIVVFSGLLSVSIESVLRYFCRMCNVSLLLSWKEINRRPTLPGDNTNMLRQLWLKFCHLSVPLIFPEHTALSFRRCEIVRCCNVMRGIVSTDPPLLSSPEGHAGHSSVPHRFRHCALTGVG